MNKGDFLKNKNQIFLIIILIIAFVLRISFFNINTALWWDEAEYLVMAKDFAFHTTISGVNIWADWNPVRPVLLPLIWAFFFKIGLGEIQLDFLHNFYHLLLLFL